MTPPTAAAPPCRDSNPFATCWTGTGRLPYVPIDGPAVADVADRLAEHGWRGQIVGPHGVGKSTLLRALAAELAQRGVVIHRHSVRRSPLGCVAMPFAMVATRRAVLLLEGCERLPAWRLGLAGWAGGLLDASAVLTTHRVAPGWPVLAQLAPSEPRFRGLFDRLTANRPTPIGPEEAFRFYRDAAGDYRAAWFGLHVEHERRTRGRTDSLGRVSVAFA